MNRKVHFEWGIDILKPMTYIWIINAPATFQHLINDVFCKFLDKKFVCYLDNTLIYFENIKQHKNMKASWYKNYKDVGLHAKLEKCMFYQL